MWMKVWRQVAVAVAAALPATAGAQRQLEQRHTVEVYAAQYALQSGFGIAKKDIGGFGLRYEFERFDPERPGRTLFDRTRGGVFATYTAKQGSPDATTLHVGVQTDASMLPRPFLGAVDPFISFGIGLFHTSQASVIPTTSQAKRISRTDFAFTPAVGTRHGVVNRAGVRLDLRPPFVFGLSTTANFVAEGGLYVSF